MQIVVNDQVYLINQEKQELTSLNLLGWLSCQTLYPKVFWKEKNSNIIRAAIGNLLSFSNFPNLNISGGEEIRLYGGMRFSTNLKGDKTWKDFPNTLFWLPHVELTQENGKITALIYTFEQAVAYSFKDSFVSSHENLLLSRNDIPTKYGWQVAVQRLLHEIDLKRLDKVVLARKSTLNFLKPISPWPFLQTMLGKTNQTTLFAFQLSPTICFLGATPEKFFQRKGTSISIDAVAATCPRGKTLEEDLAFEKSLLNGIKEQHEFQFVKKFINSSLIPLTEERKWEVSDQILKGLHVQHIFNSMKATLKQGVSDAKLLKSLHPTPALGGFPQSAALDYLDKNEEFDRGWYGAPIGIISSEGACLYVGIRSGLIDNNSLHLFSGTGIVTGSQADHEWQELEYKIGPFIEFLR